MLLFNKIFPQIDRSTRNKGTRNQWLKEKLAGVSAGLKILDVGAGECHNKQYCTHLQYVSQDFCEYEGVGDGVGLQKNTWDTSKIDIVSDITKIPVDDASFDVVVCTEVFEHIPEPALALAELSRIVKPGGCVIVTAPFCCLTHFSPYIYYSGFTKYFYEFYMKKCGLEIVECVPNGDFYTWLDQELDRVPFVNKAYSNVHVRWYEKIALRCVKAFLYRLSSAKNAEKSLPHLSSELLCFGYQVLAKKTNYKIRNL